MLNEIIVEGIVTSKQWRYDGHQFFRLASYRDTTRPTKPAPDHVENHTDKPDYVTIRMPNGLVGGVPVTVEKGQHVRIHGYLASQDGTMSLAQFLSDARGKDKPQVSKKHRGLSIDTYRVDVVPERIIVFEDTEQA